nr:hypothetical protein [Micromonospora inyonensis]
MTRLVPSEPALVIPVIRNAWMCGHQVTMVVARRWRSGRSVAAQRAIEAVQQSVDVFPVRLGVGDGEQVEQVLFRVPRGQDRNTECRREGVDEAVDVFAARVAARPRRLQSARACLPDRRCNVGLARDLHESIAGKVRPFPADPQVLSIPPVDPR